jgi:secreted PhoX family phosphatase
MREYDDPDAVVDGGCSFGDVVAERFGRRDLIKGLLATTAMAALAPALLRARSATAAEPAAFGFTEVPHGVDEMHHVAPGYDADVLIRWGDPVLPGAPAFDPLSQTAESQAKQFGYNNDYLGYIPLPAAADGTERALLCVNHEYTVPEAMFPDVSTNAAARMQEMTKSQVDIEMAAHGASIVEIERRAGKWRVVKDSRFARRITAETPMRISGPAAGHARLKTGYDPAGTQVRGMVNNCAGGITPWGTYLSCEENFDGYFLGSAAGHAEEPNMKLYGVPSSRYPWGRFHDRFDVGKEPHEPNRFGWIVETDPLDPSSVPIKRTAMGRFKHEGAESILAKDGRVVVYTGDDEAFSFVFRFVSAGRYDSSNRAAARDLLDFGVLSAARFNADGTLEWLPLVHGQGPLTQANGFAGQADVLIEARRAARLVGATRMDRPEGIAPSKVSDKVYLALTNNTKRMKDDADAANPRADNEWGHVVELTAPDRDHTAGKFKWEILVKAGDPASAEVGAMYNPVTSKDGWFACPDNVAVDNEGRLWVATDQGTAWKTASGAADGIFAVETAGPRRGTSKMFFRVPVGAEMCGPLFSPDNRTFFCAVQHPAIDGVESYEPFKRKTNFADPATRWPDFKPGMPPRPAVVVITKRDGGVIGS